MGMGTLPLACLALQVTGLDRQTPVNLQRERKD